MPIKTIIVIAGLALGASACSAQSVSAVTSASIKTKDARNTTVVESTRQNIAEQNLVGDDLFTERDLRQEVDSQKIQDFVLTSGNNSEIKEEGIYRLSGSYQNTSLVINAGDRDKIQLVLDGLEITNQNQPAIYVKSADKVWVTTSEKNSDLKVTGDYTPDGDTNLDAVIFSRSDLVLNGTGFLNIQSNEGNGISTKDDLKITGGSFVIQAAEDGLEANDSIRIHDGNIRIAAGEDGLHSENDEDLTLGYIFIRGGNITINSGDDGIRGNSQITIAGGSITIPQSKEGIEATHILIEDGSIDIYATDDGINATRKGAGTVAIRVTGGSIAISMANGDTDAFDSNGDLFISGGTIDVTARSAFDADGQSSLTGGTVRVNGSPVTSLSQGGFRGGKRKSPRR
ncbi:MAG: carbohydrate-binding domain-containing protein [Spirochaetales bacterium]|nr:carbohydrate-binding domain-containing protein [Spirochaetales bacterium]